MIGGGGGGCYRQSLGGVSLATWGCIFSQKGCVYEYRRSLYI